MSLGRLLRRRRNVYGFSPRPVSNRTLMAILGNAVHVPSAGFAQDFDLVIVRDKGVKAQLALGAHEGEYLKAGHSRTRFLVNASVVVVPCANKKRFEAKYGAPAESNARLPWWLIDSGFSALALILSAYEKGLVASFIGALDDKRVAEALSLPPDGSVVPLAIVPIGYRDRRESSAWKKANREVVRKRRLKLEEMVHWNNW